MDAPATAEDCSQGPGPALAAVRQCLTAGVPAGKGDDDGARRQWWAALATLQDDLLLPESSRGVWLAAPLPALYEPQLLERLQGWVWAPNAVADLVGGQPLLLPGARPGPQRQAAAGFQRLPLAAEDGTDPLLIVITPTVQIGLCLDGPAQQRRLVVRCEPEVLSRALGLIHRRLRADAPGQADQLRQAMAELGPLHSDPELGLGFWPRLAERLAAMAPSVTLQPLQQGPAAATPGGGEGELALLEALTHEVRTPLATIRTLIRSLLRRAELPAVVRQRLEQIDGECSEQIDRFGLIFLAAELQRQPQDREGGERLARTDLSALLRQLGVLWERQLARRNLQLDLAITPGLPAVLSDPSRLETMLGGLIDRFSRALPAGSGVRVALQPAGSRLKLQLSSHSAGQASRGAGGQSSRRAVGPVLSWNPTTGSLQLTRQATQHLFRRLGGRLTERDGSGLTVFFPVCGNDSGEAGASGPHC